MGRIWANRAGKGTTYKRKSNIYVPGGWSGAGCHGHFENALPTAMAATGKNKSDSILNVYFTLTSVFLGVNNVAYSLPYTGEPILKDTTYPLRV